MDPQLHFICVGPFHRQVEVGGCDNVHSVPWYFNMLLAGWLADRPENIWQMCAETFRQQIF